MGTCSRVGPLTPPLPSGPFHLKDLPRKPSHLRGAGCNQQDRGKTRPRILSPCCRERGTLPSPLPPNRLVPAPAIALSSTRTERESAWPETRPVPLVAQVPIPPVTRSNAPPTPPTSGCRTCGGGQAG